MAQGFTVTEQIVHAPDEVWSYLTDFANADEWMPGVENMMQTTPGPLGLDTNFSFKMRGQQSEMRVSKFEPGKSIMLTTSEGTSSATYTYDIALDGQGTEITLTTGYQTEGWWWSLLQPIFNFTRKRADSTQLSNIKAAMGPITS